MPPERAAVAPQLIFNQRLDAVLVMFFACLLWLIVADMLRVRARHLKGKQVPPLSEAPHQLTQLEEAAWARD